MHVRNSPLDHKESRLFSRRGLIFACTILFVLVVLTTTLGVSMIFGRVRNSAQQQIDSIADQSMFIVKRRYDSAVFALNALRGLFDASDTVTKDEFNQFLSTAGFKEEFPNFGAVGFIPNVSRVEKETFTELMRKPVSEGGIGVDNFIITPEGDREEYWPTIFVFPQESNGALLGFDQGSESVRADNIARARDTGEITVSDEVTLRSAGKRGAIIVAPIYRTTPVPTTIEARRESFIGVVAVSFYYADYPLGVIPPSLLEKGGVGLLLEIASGNRQQFVSARPSWSKIDPYGFAKTERYLPLNTHTPIKVVFEARVINLVTYGETQDIFLLLVAQATIIIFILLVFLFARHVFHYTVLRRRREMISSISHQLRTPLTKMRWSMDALSEKNALERKHIAKTVRENIDELNLIVHDLLLYLEWGQMNRVSKDEPFVSIKTIVKDALAKVPKQVVKKRVTSTARLSGAIKLRGRREQLVTAVYFLIDNALTYSPAGSPVTIKLVKTGKSLVEIHVVDSGYGIPIAEQPKIWETLFRASNASLGKNQGSGIGLPLARAIVEAHGGSIGFTSVEGSGSVFIIRLPLHRGRLRWWLPKLPNQPKR